MIAAASVVLGLLTGRRRSSQLAQIRPELVEATGFAPKTNDELLAMSTTLGSDATFFLSDGTAYCTGRGEVVMALPPLGPEQRAQPVYIVKPEVGLSTPAVFKALDLDSRSSADPLTLLGLHTMNAEGDDKHVNDLEPPAFSCLPDLARLKEFLAAAEDEVAGAPAGSSTDSCAAIYGLASSMPSGPVSDVLRLYTDITLRA